MLTLSLKDIRTNFKIVKDIVAKFGMNRKCLAHFRPMSFFVLSEMSQNLWNTGRNGLNEIFSSIEAQKDFYFPLQGIPNLRTYAGNTL